MQGGTVQEAIPVSLYSMLYHPLSLLYHWPALTLMNHGVI